MTEMPYDELKNWSEFFRRRPPGFREDYRTLLIMKTFGFKGKGRDVFPSIKVVEDQESAKQQAGVVLPKGKFLEHMINAVGGDDSGWKPNWRK